MNNATILQTIAKTYSDRPAISHGTDIVMNYRQMADYSARTAGGLLDGLNLKKGDRVALIMKNSPDYFPLIYAVWHAGLAAVPINAKLHVKELAYIVENSGAKACFFNSNLADGLMDELGADADLQHLIETGSKEFAELSVGEPIPVAEVEPDDLAWLFYTSGTTGRPKGAMLSHRNLVAMTMNYYSDVDAVEPEDCMIHAAPLSHGSGCYALPHVAHGANNIIPKSGGFDVAETLQLIEHWQGATFFFAPTMITRLINAPNIEDADLSNLKTIVYGGAPMYLEDVFRALDILGPKLMQIYGQGESPMTITGVSKRIYRDTGSPHYSNRLASAGMPRTDVEVRIVDEDGNELPVGEIGEVTCRGDVVMGGYWNNPEATAKSLRDGWLWTGDMGAFDEDGFMTLKDRSKDMIISGGTNIYPREIEEVLLRHDGVYECAVIGIPHPDWGEEVMAFITRRDGSDVDEQTLDALCLENIARFKRPKHYRFVEELPKNNYGKILKTVLREEVAASA